MHYNLVRFAMRAVVDHLINSSLRHGSARRKQLGMPAAYVELAGRRTGLLCFGMIEWLARGSGDCLLGCHFAANFITSVFAKQERNQNSCSVNLVE